MTGVLGIDYIGVKEQVAKENGAQTRVVEIEEGGSSQVGGQLIACLNADKND